MDTHNIHILCIDDEELALTLRKLVLEMQGYQVLTARSATDAMQVLEVHDVDLVLADQVMPGGTGTELTRSIKKKWPDLPVILISGINEIPPDAIYADLFISKVEGPEVLCAKISSILSTRRCSSS
ncbi:MAG: response regulator [Terracidiphilus sp.]